MRDPASVSFRAAGRDDARAVAELHADSWRRHYREAYSDAFLAGIDQIVPPPPAR
jgi:hypothetical protein